MNKPAPMSSGKILAVFAAILLWAAFLRLLGIDQETPWLDEVFILERLDADSFAEFWGQTPREDLPAQLAPLYSILAWGWSRCMGSSVEAMRGLSLLAGLASLPALYLLARRVVGVSGALLATLLLACSLPHIYYSQEIRRYAFDTLFAILSGLALLRALEAKSTPERRRWGAIHAAMNAALLWCTVYSAPMIAAQACYVALRKRELFWSWAAAQSVSAVAYGVYACLFLHAHDLAPYSWMAPPTPRDMGNLLVCLAGGRFGNENPSSYLPWNLSLELPLTLMLYGLALAQCFCWFREGRRADAMLWTAWLCAPGLMAAALSWLWTPCFLFRYVLFSIPALAVLSAGAWSRLPAPNLRHIMLAFLLGLYLFQGMAHFQHSFRPDYQQAARIVQRETLPGDAPILVLKELYNAVPLRFAAPALASRIVPAHGAGDLKKHTLELAHTKPLFWILMWRWDEREHYERLLLEQELAFSCHTLGGMPPLFLYRVEKP